MVEVEWRTFGAIARRLRGEKRLPDERHALEPCRHIVRDAVNAVLTEGGNTPSNFHEKVSPNTNSVVLELIQDCISSFAGELSNQWEEA